MTMNTQGDRASRYRALAIQMRASSRAVRDEDARHAMLEAARVWDKLADLADRKISLVIKTTSPMRLPRP